MLSEEGTTRPVRRLRVAIVVSALLAAGISGGLLMDQDRGWETTSGTSGFLSSMCRSKALPDAQCAEVIGSRWGSFDLVVNGRTLVFPTALFGLAYFLFAAVWFILVNPFEASVKSFRVMTIGLVGVGFLGSVAFIAVMAFLLSHWCPQCLAVHGLNGIMFVATLWSARITANHSSLRSETQSVEYYRNKLAWTAAVLGLVFPVGCWAYFDSASAVRLQWRKHLTCREAIASMQNDAAFLLREYFSQPIVSIPPRIQAGLSNETPETCVDPRLVLFTDYGCSACRCFERQKIAMIDPVFMHGLHLEVRHFPKGGGVGAFSDVEQESTVQGGALASERLAEAARILGGEPAFEVVHKALFDKATRDNGYTQIAARVGIEPEILRATAAGLEVRARIDDDIQAGISLGIESTPAVFLNDRRVPDICLSSPVFWARSHQSFSIRHPTPPCPWLGESPEMAVLQVEPLESNKGLDPSTRESLRPLRRTDLRVHELDGEALIYDVDRADTHRLNTTAFQIWQCCDGSRDATRIAEELVDVYNVTQEVAHEHVLKIFEEFRARHLTIETVNAESA